jgi:hypothetical protein
MGQCCGCPKPRTELNQNEIFFQACSLNNVDLVRKLITDPDIRRHLNLNEGLIVSIVGGSVFDLLVAQPDIDINWHTDRGVSALHIAVFVCRHEEHVDILKKLLAHPNIDVNIKDKFGRTPLMIAARANCNTFALMLAHPNIDVLAEDNHGNTALAYAANEEIKNLILDKMPPVIAQDIFIMSVPPNTEDAISYETIERGMLMVDFHGEREFGRYYTKKTYDALSPKRNLMTRRPILKSEVVYYMADVPRA